MSTTLGERSRPRAAPWRVPGRWIAVIVVAIAAAVAAFVVLRGGDEHRATRLEAQLEQLGSSDGLYTLPQVRSQPGFSLQQTAFARAALRALGAPVPAVAAAARPLSDGSDDTRVERAWYAALAGGQAPARPAAVRGLWRAALAARTPDDRLQRAGMVAEVVALERLGPSALGAVDRRAGARLMAATAAVTDPAQQLWRLHVQAALRLRPDAATRRLGAVARVEGRGADPSLATQQAAAVVEAAVRSGRRPAPAVLATLVDRARAAREPWATYVAARALRLAGAPTAPLAPLAATVRGQLGALGAVRTAATFPVVPKAVWLVAHLREAAGAPALGDRRQIALSRLMAREVGSFRDDPDDFGFLLASAGLTGLTYSGPSYAPLPAPPGDLGSPEQAFVWNQRVQVADDLHLRIPPVRVTPWALGDDADVGAVGAVLATARRVGAPASVPAAFTAAFARRATATRRFGSVRWALYAAAGLAATGRSAAADRIVASQVHLGCRDFRLLVADTDGTCDLESTLLLLELRGALPSARRLAAPLTEAAHG